MPVTIKVNNLSLVHRGSGGVSRATLPDVCKTPPGMVPVPYPNTTFSRDLERGTATVDADGGRMIAVNGSIFTPSTGDEPGAGGGVVSGVHKKESRWLTYSMDVKIEGRNACRLTDKKLHNHGNTVNAGGEMQSNPGGKSLCDWENRDGAVVGAGGPPCGCEPNEPSTEGVPPITPTDCVNTTALKKIVFINGIMNSGDDHCKWLKAVADKHCGAVTGVYNESDGFFKDLVQCVKDKLGIGDNPAVDTLSGIIDGHVSSGQPLEIIGHSQGALIASRASYDVLNGAAIDSSGTIAPDWSQLTVTTYGGAAWTFPNGINVTHVVNLIDPVPLLFGATGVAGGALVGGLAGGLSGAMLGGAAGLLAKTKDLSTFFDLAKNPHSRDVYLRNSAPAPCLCKGE